MRVKANFMCAKESAFTAGAVLAGAMLILPSGQAIAQDNGSAASRAMLEEIVVTSRRREESLADLPMSVTAFTAEGMQALGIHDIMDVSENTPNVTFTHTGRRSVSALYIRGIGNSSPTALRASGSGVYIDGHYMPNTVGNMMNTVDVERIEVMRGPQGTLFGKNTTGGAINVISAKPGPERAASMTVRSAEFGQRDFRGMVNMPINDSLSTRFSYAKETSDGYYYNRTLSEMSGATDLEAISAALRFTPNDNWTIDLSFRGNYQNDDNAPGECTTRPTQSQVDNLANGSNVNHPAQIYSGPVYEDGRAQWGGPTRYPDGSRTQVGGHIERLYAGATLDYWNDCLTDQAAGDFVFSAEKKSFLKLDNEQFGAIVNWDSAGAIGSLDNLSVKTTFSTHDTNYYYLQDRDFSSIPLDAIGSTGNGQLRTTESLEILLTADVNENLSFLVGAHFFKDDVNNGTDCMNKALANLPALKDPNSGFSIGCTRDGGTQFDWLSSPRQAPGGPVPSGRGGTMLNESSAIFAHMTYSINDDWTLDVGGRFTDEDRSFLQTEFETVSETCSFGQPGDPRPTELCDPTYILSYGSMFDAGFYNDTTANFKVFTPMASLTKELDNGMIYLSYSEGFLSGAFNDELNATKLPELVPLLTYEPEYVKNYEIGLKGTFLDGRMTLAGAAFYMDYSDKQEQVSIDNSAGLYGGDPDIGIVTNAGQVDIYGIEAELRAIPWTNGFFMLDVGYLQSEYSEFASFDSSAPGGGSTIDQSNLTIADFSPEWTVSASVEHEIELSNGATLTPNLGMYYQSDYDFIGGLDGSKNESSFCAQDAYSKFRARVTYRPTDGDWQASLFGNNITDERYKEWCGNGRGGTYYARITQPATWGMEFSYNWGS
jgi:iron complex outermembrane receptor protein